MSAQSENVSPMLRWRKNSLQGWGGAISGVSDVLQPTTSEEVRRAILSVAQAGESLGFRGSGCSYGDASLNSPGKVLDLSQMNRVLSFDPERGLARVQPGVTIEQLWQRSISHGFWPAVVPGTMKVSVGGAAALNIHGKNNYAVGTFGEHIRSFKLITPTGEEISCSSTDHADLFFSAIGGLGMLGCFTELELQLKKVHSGRVRVNALVAANLEEQIRLFEELRCSSDYLVSWVDLYGRGASLGRGVLHRAVNFQSGEDPTGKGYLSAIHQRVPTHVLGFVPKGWLWPAMWVARRMGLTGWINATKMKAGTYEERKGSYCQSHGAFHFLLDYVPRWHWMTKPRGLIQFQPFVPLECALEVLSCLIEDCQRAALVPYLGVLKRHRSDPFLLTHGLDGFSLAMDFAIPSTSRHRARLWDLCDRMTDRVLTAGGRFYYAKDSTLRPSDPLRIHGADALRQFRDLKANYDPERVLQSSLARRLGLL